MKKLLNTLYITSNEKYLSLDGETVVISEHGTECARIPGFLQWRPKGGPPEPSRLHCQKHQGV